MIRKMPILVCDGEHGRDVIFPDLVHFLPSNDDLTRPRTPTQLRGDAKKTGWVRKDGRDLCDLCAESGKEEAE